LTVEGLAERAGLSPREVLYIEHGRRNAKALTLIALAQGLGVPPGTLFDGQ
jgi:transcriptional regulator with XRE-family HTH domain